MKTHVIPNGVRDLTKGHGSRKLRRVINASSVRSFAPLRMTVGMAKHYKKTLLAFSLVCTCAAVAWLALPKPELLDGISFSQCVRDHNEKLLRVTLTSDQKFRVWTSLSDISPALIDAALRFEDKYYRRHPGVNPFALLRSALNLRASG